MSKNSSIFKEILIIIIIGFFFIIGIFCFFEIIFINSKMEKELVTINENLANRLIICLKTHILNFNKNDTNKILEMEFKSNKNIFMIVIENKYNNFFSGKIRDKEWHIIDFENDKDIFIKERDLILKEVEIRDNNNLLGYMKIYLTKKFKNQELLTLLFLNLLRIFLLVIFLIIFLKLILDKKLILPLKEIIEKTRYLVIGNLSQNFELPLKNEIGVFANNLNIFLFNINTIFSQLIEMIDYIEKKFESIAQTIDNFYQSHERQLINNKEIFQKIDNFYNIMENIKKEIENNNKNSSEIYIFINNLVKRIEDIAIDIKDVRNFLIK